MAMKLKLKTKKWDLSQPNPNRLKEVFMHAI